jgi:hypothetical protein
MDHESGRSFEGIDVAGRSSQVVPDYWATMIAERGHVETFEEFSLRYQDLEFEGPQAQEAALSSFRQWCQAGGILGRFDAYWSGARTAK